MSDDEDVKHAKPQLQIFNVDFSMHALFHLFFHLKG